MYMFIDSFSVLSDWEETRDHLKLNETLQIAQHELASLELMSHTERKGPKVFHTAFGMTSNPVPFNSNGAFVQSNSVHVSSKGVRLEHVQNTIYKRRLVSSKPQGRVVGS